jgi:hypothetical protein
MLGFGGEREHSVLFNNGKLSGMTKKIRLSSRGITVF